MAASFIGMACLSSSGCLFAALCRPMFGRSDGCCIAASPPNMASSFLGTACLSSSGCLLAALGGVPCRRRFRRGEGRGGVPTDTSSLFTCNSSRISWRLATTFLSRGLYCDRKGRGAHWSQEMVGSTSLTFSLWRTFCWCRTNITGPRTRYTSQRGSQLALRLSFYNDTISY